MNIPTSWPVQPQHSSTVVFHVCVGGQKVCRVAEFLVPSIVISMVGGVTASPLHPVRNAAHTRSNRDKMILATT